MAYPRYQRARDFKVVNSSAAADYSITTSWAVIDATNLSITLAVQVGDVVELTLRATIPSASNSAVFFDFEVAGARFGDATNGCFVTHATPNLGTWSGTVVQYRTIVAGDVSSGTANFKPWAKVSSAMTIESTTPPVVFCARNLGPQDPN